MTTWHPPFQQGFPLWKIPGHVCLLCHCGLTRNVKIWYFSFDMTSLLIYSTSRHERNNICDIATKYGKKQNWLWVSQMIEMHIILWRQITMLNKYDLFICHSFFTKTWKRQCALLAQCIIHKGEWHYCHIVTTYLKQMH